MPRLPSLRLLLASLTLIGFGVTGCDNSSSPTNPAATPTPDPVELVTETFQGAVAQTGASTHFFVVANLGTISFGLSDLQPLSTITLGLGVGTPSVAAPDTCELFASDSAVRSGQTLQASASVVGNYCVTVFDVGNIFPGQTISYTLKVVHP
jgi:hypothetical protein